MARRCDFSGKGSIIFEGKELPSFAKGFDLVPFWSELPEAIQDWLWDLRYCWGRTRSLNSREVLRYAKIVREKLNANRPAAIQVIQKAFPDVPETEAAEGFQEWLTTLDLIEDAAKQTRECHWTVHAQDECLEKNLAVALQMARQSGAAPTGFEFHVRKLPRVEQLKWLAGFSDSLSAPRSPGPVWWNKLKRLWKKSG